MIKKVNDALFNTHVIPSDWRYSAAIVGLEKYLYNQNLEYEIKDEYFAFNQEDITRERFLEFAEEYYSLSFPHLILSHLLFVENVNLYLLMIIILSNNL